MKRLSPKGIVVGGVVDIVASNLAAIPLAIVAALRIDVRHLPRDEQSRALLEVLRTTPSLFVTQLLLGALCSILGGYVAARLAKRSELVNGALSAFLCIAFGLYAMATKPDSLGPWAHVAFLVVSPALGALGGLLALRRKCARSRPNVPVASAA
jgi:putative membrane protein (TIGR04086 family)